ncbi:hypothetical protein [Aeromonas dhakensis]|uniref:hypothetical protein n=1 Tax=Aeromonas dhakensis TaxID=196024 RepID=UPI000B25B77A|nr:hypothetical protein [Aeromonas dhakensis]
MNSISLYRMKTWAKQGETPLARLLWRLAKGARSWSFPLIPPLHGLLYRLYRLASQTLATLARTLWWTPLFQSRLRAPAPASISMAASPLSAARCRSRWGRIVASAPP